MAQTMLASGMTDGQIDDLANKLRDAARKHRGNISSDAAQQALRSSNIGMRLFAKFREIVEAEMILIPREPVSITISQARDPDEYFRDREGFWGWDGMRELVVAKAAKVEAGAKFNLAVADLGKDAVDAQIVSGLPQDHFFDESPVCAIIAEMIQTQWGGKPGPLLNNGYANLFYGRSCVVGVGWRPVRREWHVNAWYRDVRKWRAGDRVFSPAN